MTNKREEIELEIEIFYVIKKSGLRGSFDMPTIKKYIESKIASARVEAYDKGYECGRKDEHKNAMQELNKYR